MCVTVCLSVCVCLSVSVCGWVAIVFGTDEQQNPLLLSHRIRDPVGPDVWVFVGVCAHPTSNKIVLITSCQSELTSLAGGIKQLRGQLTTQA